MPLPSGILNAILEEQEEASTFLPTLIPGLKTWLSAATGVSYTLSSVVSSWTDPISGAVFTPKPIGPTYVVNSQPSLSFNPALTQGLACATYGALAQPFDYFVRFSQNNATISSQGFIIDFGAIGTSDVAQLFMLGNSNTLDMASVKTTTIANSTQLYAEVQWNGTSTFLGVNGVQSTAGNSGASTGAALTIGVAASLNVNFFKGNIYEILVFSRILSANERSQVNAYLAAGVALGN